VIIYLNVVHDPRDLTQIFCVYAIRVNSRNFNT